MLLEMIQYSITSIIGAIKNIYEEMNKPMEESEVGPTSIDVSDEHDSWRYELETKITKKY